MHTQEEVQVTFQASEINTQQGLVLRGTVEVRVPWPPQDERFVEHMERSVDQAGQMLKRDWMRLTLEQADAEVVLERLRRDRAQQRRGKRKMTFKTTFGTVIARRYRLLDKATGKISTPSADAWNTPRQLTITRPLRDLVRDVVRDESYRKTAQRVACHAGEDDLLSPTSVMNILHEEGAALGEATLRRVETSYQQFPEAEGAFAAADAESRKEIDADETLGSSEVEEVWEPPVGFGREGVEGQSEGRRRVDDQHVLVQVDEVKVKAQPQTGRDDLWTYTAVVMTAAVTRNFVAGSAVDLWRQVGAFLATFGIHRGQYGLLLLADGASWIRAWFEGLPLTNKTMILCWYHLAKKCGESLSRACRGKEHRNDVQRGLLNLLWEGKLQEGLAYLDSRRDEMKSSKAIDDLKSYLERRAAYLPNYSVRREAGLWIASNRVEKLNDATVSDRCKGRGMAWTPAGVLSLARLEATDSNGEFECWTWQRELPHWHGPPRLGGVTCAPTRGRAANLQTP